MKKHFIIPIFVPHKGCPHDCIFCNQKKITGQLSEVDEEFVSSEMQKYLMTIPDVDRVVELSFYGGSFTGLPINEQLSLLRPAKKALDDGYIDAIRLSTRPDYINEDILDALKQNGVSIIELGVQSMDDSVLIRSNRGHTAGDVYKASELIKGYGFVLGLQMMVGLPGDNEEKDLYTADEFIGISPSMVRIYPALVIKDTYMEHMYRKGWFEPLSLDGAVDICSKLYLKFEREDIKIIRMGLQPTDSINEGKDIVAGPFHPAFKELVESRILNNMVMFLYKRQTKKDVIAKLNEKSISKLYSDKKRYFKNMLNGIKPGTVMVAVDNELAVNSVKLIGDENSQILSLKDYSHFG